MAKVELKKPVVEEISGQIKDAQAVVLVHYLGLSVEQDTALRKELREAGVTYKVYKNTMMNFAFQGTPCEELSKHLEGPNAMAISTEDATAPARILAKYAKDIKPFELIAGVVEGKYMDAAGIEALSKISSREELLGKLLGSIQSPITNFARVLNQIAEQGGAVAAEAPAEEAKAEEPAEAPVVEEAKAEEAVETPVAEEVVEEVAEAPAAEEVVEEVAEAPAAEEVVEEVAEAPAAEEVVEEVAEAPAAEEVVEEVVEAPAAEEVVEEKAEDAE